MPFMAWGAYVAGLVADLGGPVTSNEQGVSVYISAIPFNFYAILMVLITLLSALEIFPDFGLCARRSSAPAPPASCCVTVPSP